MLPGTAENSGEYEVWTLLGPCDSDITPTPTPQGVTLGDVNSDGTIDIIDALIVAQAYVGLNPQEYNPEAADTNCDGNIDIIDALLIAQYYVGLVNSFC